MGHSWMKTNRLSLAYEKWVFEFLEYAKIIFLMIIKSFIVLVLYEIF